MNKQWTLITSIKQLNQVAESVMAAPVIGIDTETTGLDPHTEKVRLVQIAVEGEPTLIIDCFEVLPEGKELLQDMMTSNNVKVF